jgi:hypothetical protein
MRLLLLLLPPLLLLLLPCCLELLGVPAGRGLLRQQPPW